jgi:TRAP-type mannitol/chloroaromatic compound transport system permease small subunit
MFYHAIYQNLSVVNLWIGRLVALMIPIMVMAVVAVIICRTLWHDAVIAVQESALYCHALVVMLANGYSLHQGSHVSVDVLHARLSLRARAWIAVSGHILFLFPFALATFYFSLPFVVQSWLFNEASIDAGGIPGVYLLKSLLLINAVLLFIQGIAECAKQLGLLTSPTET